MHNKTKLQQNNNKRIIFAIFLRKMVNFLVIFRRPNASVVYASFFADFWEIFVDFWRYYPWNGKMGDFLVEQSTFLVRRYTFCGKIVHFLGKTVRLW